MDMKQETAEQGRGDLAADLKVRVGSLIDSLVELDNDKSRDDFEHLMQLAGELWRRKQNMEGTKTASRDLLGEVLFSRLRRSFREFLAGDDSVTETKAAEWVMGCLFSGTVLTEFANCLDKVILESVRPQDFSFAGRVDFISIEEVLQLLGGGKYTGMLSIEKVDNRLDIYMDRGSVAYLDPHHLVRRVMPGVDSLNYQEIPADLLKQAEVKHADDSTPLLVSLVELGFLPPEELSDQSKDFGLEVLFDFLGDDGACSFYYRRLKGLPDFVKENNMRMQVTPILLEGNKRIDDWIDLLKVFPEPTEPVQPEKNMFARMEGLNLTVLDLKLLAMIDGKMSPKELAPAIGLPIFDLYQYLVRFAREGVLVPAGGKEALDDVHFSMEESMEMAFKALDANDDEKSRSSALDDVLGGIFDED